MDYKELSWTLKKITMLDLFFLLGPVFKKTWFCVGDRDNKNSYRIISFSSVYMEYETSKNRGSVL